MIYLSLITFVLGWWGLGATIMGERDAKSSRNLMISIFLVVMSLASFTHACVSSLLTGSSLEFHELPRFKGSHVSQQLPRFMNSHSQGLPGLYTSAGARAGTRARPAARPRTQAWSSFAECGHTREVSWACLRWPSHHSVFVRLFNHSDAFRG